MSPHNVKEKRSSNHIHSEDVGWKRFSSTPETEVLLRVLRTKRLIGGDHIPQEDFRFGVFELAPFATYPGHLHPAPEIYFVVSGKAEWTAGDETFVAEPSTLIYHAPLTIHKMVNLTEEVLVTVWAQWAPGGDRSVFDSGYRLVEQVPEQPSNAMFPK